MHRMNRREFARTALGASAVLGVSLPSIAEASWAQAQSHAPRQGPTDDIYANVNPELLPAIKAFPTLAFSQQVLAEARKAPMMPPLAPPAPPLVKRKIPGPRGAPDVRILVIDPSPGEKSRPLFLHTHGGGYITPNPAMGPFLQRIAMDCHCVVVSVDYRLAPETKFPGSLEDNYAALRWAHSNAEMLGIDRKRIAVGGESAGGGHAAALAIHARDRGEIPIAFQMLIYPMLDDRTGSTRPAPLAVGKFVWIAESNRFGWTALLGVPAGSADVPKGSVPARVHSVAGLPPAYIGVGSIDLFVNEDIEYARRLIDAGIPTELVIVPGAYHGFDILVPDTKISRWFTDSWHRALQAAFSQV